MDPLTATHLYNVLTEVKEEDKRLFFFILIVTVVASSVCGFAVLVSGAIQTKGKLV